MHLLFNRLSRSNLWFNSVQFHIYTIRLLGDSEKEKLPSNRKIPPAEQG